MKNYKKILALLLILISMYYIYSLSQNKTIGSITGPENDIIKINNVKYIKYDDNKFSNKDKDKYLGKVSNSKITMRVYSVKGDKNKDFIYTLWDWEGDFYIREDLLD